MRKADAYRIWGREAAVLLVGMLLAFPVHGRDEYRLSLGDSKPMFSVRGGTYNIKHGMRVSNGHKDVVTGWQPIWWQMPTDMEPGEYYVGLECVQETSWNTCDTLDWVYHNGELFHFDHWTPPMAESNDLWSATAFCSTPRMLKPGDVLGMQAIRFRHRGPVLVKRLPSLSRLETGSTFPWRRPTFHQWPDALAQASRDERGQGVKIDVSVHYYGKTLDLVYVDGRGTAIELVAGYNLTDYADPDPAPSNSFLKRAPRTMVAWQSEQAPGGSVSLLRLDWPNPRPDVEVAYMTLDIPNWERNCELGLLGITAGNAAEAERK